MTELNELTDFSPIVPAAQISYGKGEVKDRTQRVNRVYPIVPAAQISYRKGGGKGQNLTS